MGQDNDTLFIAEKFNAQCTLCKWSRCLPNTNEFQLYRYIFDLAMNGTSYNAMATLTEKYIVQAKFDIKPPRKKSVWLHFKKHVSLEKFTLMQAAKSNYISGKHIPLHDNVELSAVNKETFDEYDELCKLYKKFSQTYDTIYGHRDSLQVEVPSEDNVWSNSKLTTYNQMVNTMRGILTEISKMRQGDKLIEIASKFIIETFTKSLVVKLKNEFETFSSIMRQQGVNNSVIDAFNALTSQRLIRLFSEEAGNAITLTKKEFKLPN